jgi:hypothetical protein
MTKQAASSKKQPIKNGSVCLQCRRAFNDQSSLKKHRDRGSRECAPGPNGFARGAAPGMFMLPVTSTYATYICTAPATALGQEMSLLAAALEAQDTESADNCKPAAVCQDDPPLVIILQHQVTMVTPLGITLLQPLAPQFLRIVYGMA